MNASHDVYACNVYAKLLFPLGYGHPLWVPEPGRNGEVLVGDVGFIESGHFYRLFNAFHSASDNSNANGVPEHFQPLLLPPNQVVEVDINPPHLIHSETLRPVGENVENMFELECIDDQGAFLVLKDPPTQAQLHLSKRIIKNYMLANCEEWAAFAQSGLKPDDIRLVSGWVKTDEWFMGAITQNGRSAKIQLDANFTPMTSLRFLMPRPPDVVYGRRVGPWRSDPDNRADALDDDPPRDQCIFLNYYKLKTRLLFIKDIEGAAEPKDLQVRRDSDDSGRLLANHSPNVDADTSDVFRKASAHCKPWDPVDFVLGYILLHSDAQIAFAGTEDIVALCGADIPNDIPGYLERMRPHIEVDDDGVGSLSFKTTVLRPRSKAAQSVDHKLANNTHSVDKDPVDSNATDSMNHSVRRDVTADCRKQALQRFSPQNCACGKWAHHVVAQEVARVEDAAKAITCP